MTLWRHQPVRTRWWQSEERFAPSSISVLAIPQYPITVGDVRRDHDPRVAGPSILAGLEGIVPEIKLLTSALDAAEGRLGMRMSVIASYRPPRNPKIPGCDGTAILV
jgi:hypothetical protein